MVDRLEEIRGWLKGRGAAMQKQIEALAVVNSFSENPEGGRIVARMLVDQIFDIAALNARIFPSQKYGDHVVFKSTGLASRAPIALIGHLDTVFPPGTFDGYRVEGDLARGPGVLDMKGGLVVVAWALRAIAEVCGMDAVAPLRVVVVSDEEVGSPEGKSIIRQAISDAKAALVFESGRKSDAIVTSRKGVGIVTAIAQGRAAHAGNDIKLGANAIRALSRFVESASTLTDFEVGTTVSVGRIEGGTSTNTVPDRASCDVDLRFVRSHDGERLMESLRAAADGAAIEGTKIVIEGGIVRDPLERTPANVALMRAYAECAQASGLGSAEAPLVGGGSDASTSSAMGIASIDGLGPRGAGFHTKDEFIELASLVPKAEALARFLLTFGAQ